MFARLQPVAARPRTAEQDQIVQQVMDMNSGHLGFAGRAVLEEETALARW